MTMIKPMCSILLGFLFYLSLVCSLENKEYDTQQVHHPYPLHHYHTLGTSFLLPSNACRPSKEARSNKAFLKVVHKHGPCSTFSEHKVNNAFMPHTEILQQDQFRVNSIHSKLLMKKSNDTFRASATAVLPVDSGNDLGSGNYMVTVGLGTPKKELSLVFDTGSDLTWTQCEPCSSYCYKQDEPIFQPLSSSSFANISCASQFCTNLMKSTKACSWSRCTYKVLYEDNSYSIGFFGQERLTLTSTEVFDDFIFGYGQNNRGQFGTTVGLLGLGRHKLSFIEQTSEKYSRHFSYCLPSTPSSTGFLSFGYNGKMSKTLKFTPLSNVPKSFYVLIMTKITIGGRQIPIAKSVSSNAGIIIDSGTVISRLPPKVYKVMRDEFRRKMSVIYPRTKGFSIMDTCYDVSGFNRIVIPKVSFHFIGGVEVKLDMNGIVYMVSLRQVCYTDMAIFGSIQQKTLQIMYDVDGGKIGFGSAGCD